MIKEDEKMVLLSEIEIDKPLIKTIKYKPTFSVYAVIIIGILLMLTRHIAFVLLGLFFIGLACIVLFVVKEKDTLSIYENFVIVHDFSRPDYGRKVLYDDIVEWNCSSKDGNSSGITLKLIGDEVVYKDTFQTSAAFKELNKIMPAKETQAIRIEENKKKQLVFDNPVKYVKNFFNKKDR